MTAETTYNGWTNHATWNMYNWMTATETLYAHARQCRDESVLVMFASEMVNAGHFGTDFADTDLRTVNWLEVWNALTEDNEPAS